MKLKNKGFYLSLAVGALVWPRFVRAAEPAPQVVSPAGNPSVAADSESIDDRFAIEGYLGIYGAFLQQTLPTWGLTGSVYLDDELRFGADLSRGSSKAFFSDFRTQGGSVWAAMEMADSFWLKGGLSYTRLDKPTSQEPLSVLLEGKNKNSTGGAVRSDFLGLDVAIGQMWVFPKYSVSVDYAGFTLPALRLTGPKLPLFGVQLARAEFLYNFE
jgi:hypothetical protein